MFISAYDTTLCRNFKIDTLTKELDKAFMDLIARDNLGLPSQIYPILPSDIAVPQFAHPFILKPTAGAFHDTTAYLIDVRSCVRVDRETQRNVIVSRDEFEFQRLRAILTKHANEKGVEDLFALGSFPTKFFATWVGENLARKLALDARVQMVVTIICAIYFISMFRSEGTAEFTEKEKIKYIGFINRVLQYPPQEIADIMDRAKPMTNLSDLVAGLIELSGSVRLESINVPFIYTALNGSWFGFNNREVVAVSLEHIPTLYAIIFAATSQRAYSKTTISKLIERLNRKGEATDFVKSVMRLPDVTVSK